MIPVASEPRFSVVPDDPQEVAAVKHVAALFKMKMKPLVLAAMWRGLRDIILDRDLIDTGPLPTVELMAAQSAQELRALVRREQGAALHHSDPTEGTPGQTKLAGELAADASSADDPAPVSPAKLPRRMKRASNTGKKPRGWRDNAL
jgi:hypothetical protein